MSTLEITVPEDVWTTCRGGACVRVAEFRANGPFVLSVSTGTMRFEDDYHAVVQLYFYIGPCAVEASFRDDFEHFADLRQAIETKDVEGLLSVALDGIAGQFGLMTTLATLVNRATEEAIETGRRQVQDEMKRVIGL